MTRIADLTVEHLGSIATELDLIAFQAAARNYLAADPFLTNEYGEPDEAEAVDAIFGNGDFWKRVQLWAPDEAAAAEAGSPS